MFDVVASKLSYITPLRFYTLVVYTLSYISSYGYNYIIDIHTLPTHSITAVYIFGRPYNLHSDEDNGLQGSRTVNVPNESELRA